MDFFDSLKSIKKEMQTHSKEQKNLKNSNKNFNKEIKTQPPEMNLDKEMQEVFLKQEKLQDEFLEFIKNADIKKI